jgi:hypothetical protein
MRHLADIGKLRQHVAELLGYFERNAAALIHYGENFLARHGAIHTRIRWRRLIRPGHQNLCRRAGHTLTVPPTVLPTDGARISGAAQDDMTGPSTPSSARRRPVLARSRV